MAAPVSADKVTVFLRIKPILDPKNSTIRQLTESSLITVPPASKTNPNPIEFQFHHILNGNTPQDEVFERTTAISLNQFLSGRDALLFAYGVTSSGKTYTIQGTETNRGVLPRTINTIMSSLKTTHTHLQLRFSMLELYDGKIKDLLYDDKSQFAGKPLHFVFGGDKTQGYVQGQNFRPVTSFEQCMRMVDVGTSRRKVASTLLNTESSRSHCVYHLQLWNLGSESSNDAVDDSACIANLSIIDLAGAERSSKTGAQAGSTTQSETNSINSSLLKLHDLIAGSYKNYRSDVLTKVVSRYFAGPAKVTVICNVNPSSTEYEETLASLRWASVASKTKQQSLIQGPGVSNAANNAKMVNQLMGENEILRNQLQFYQKNSNGINNNGNTGIVSSGLNNNSNNNYNGNDSNVNIDTIREELFQQFLQTQHLATVKLQQDYCQLAIEEFNNQNPNHIDLWNANTGKNDSFEDLTTELQKIVAKDYHHKYHTQITMLLDQNDKLQTELSEQDEMIEVLQKKGLQYYHAYKALYSQIYQIKHSMEELSDTHNTSVQEMEKCQNYFQNIEDNIKSSTSKMIDPYSESYSLLINKYQLLETENTALKIELQSIQVPSSAVKVATRASARKAPAAIDCSDQEDAAAFLTPKPKTRTTTKTAVKKQTELEDVMEGDEDLFSGDDDSDDSDDSDDDDSGKKSKSTKSVKKVPVVRTTRATTTLRKTAATSTTATTSQTSVVSTPSTTRVTRSKAALSTPASKRKSLDADLDEQPKTVKKRALGKTANTKTNEMVSIDSTTNAKEPAPTPRMMTRRALKQ